MADLRPFPFPSLGRGLNLRDKADAVQPDEAIDCMDVEFLERGTLKERAGYTNFTSATLTERGASLEPFYKTDGTKQLIVGCSTRLEALNTSGGIVASLTTLTAGTWDFARFGSPNNERLYAGQGDDTLRRWDGSAWTSPGATMPKAGALAVMARSNRLVAARFNTTTGGPSGATSSPSHVWFSNAGDPETWGANDFVQVTPSDGEKVQAVVAWREFVFIFKETKFFVVIGETVDSNGNPRFELRPVDTGVGLVSPRAVSVAEDGVYFMDRRGIFKTTGNDPQLISDPIRPIFQGGASIFYTGGVLSTANITQCALHFFNDRVFVGFPTGSTNDRVLVWDTQLKWWSIWGLPAAAFATFRASSDSELHFARATGSNHIDRMAASILTDAGSAIGSYWRGGWFDHGFVDQHRVAEVKVWGSGQPGIALTTDFKSSPGTTTALDLRPQGGSGTLFGGAGTYGAGTGIFGDEGTGLEPGLPIISGEGTYFSTYINNTVSGQSFSIDRVTHHVAGKHIPSVIGSP